MRTVKQKMRSGYSAIEIILGILFVSVMASALLLVFKPATDAFASKSALTNDYQIINSGVSNYYNDAYQYPKASDWSWSSGNYVSNKIVNKGWQYSCSGTSMVLTTPPIDDAKVRQQLVVQFGNSLTSGSATISGTSIAITATNHPCP